MPNGHSSVLPRTLTLAADVSPALLDLLQHLDHLGLRQTLLTPRRAGTAAREKLGQRSMVRRVGSVIGGMVAFPRLAVASNLPGLGRTADLVYVHGDDAVHVGLGLATAALWDIPVVIALRDEGPPARAERTSLVAQLVHRAALRGADVLLTSSPRQAERLVAAGAAPGRVRVLSATDAEQHALALLDIYAAVWARHMARQVAVWHPTTG